MTTGKEVVAAAGLIETGGMIAEVSSDEPL
jgi:hypothetical protein